MKCDHCGDSLKRKVEKFDRKNKIMKEVPNIGYIRNVPESGKRRVKINKEWRIVESESVKLCKECYDKTRYDAKFKKEMGL